MTSVTVEASRLAPVDMDGQDPIAQDSEPGPLRELQQRLLRAVTAGGSKETAVAGIADAVAAATDPATMVYFERDASNHWSEQYLLHETQTGLPSQLRQQLVTWCDDACRHGSVQINAIGLPHGGLAVTVPILLKGTPPDAFTTVYSQTTTAVDRLVVIHQLVAAHVALWQVLGQTQQAEFEAQTSAVLMELLATMESAGDLREAYYRLVNELQSHLGCQRVAVALSRRGNGHCQLQALSGMAKFDQRSEVVRVIEAALDESIVRDTLTVWPTGDELQRQAGLAHEKLRATTAAGCIVSCPLRDEAGDLVGAWLFLGDAEFAQSESKLAFIEASGRPIGSRIRLLQKARQGRTTRLVHSLLGPSRTLRRRVGVIIICMVLAVLCVPVRYNIGCQCTVKPVIRRFVVSPHDGILQESFVEPGDIVAKSQLLARMDGREIEWAMAGLEAEFNRAKKERDATLAQDDVAAAQRAKLEMKRLQLKQELLQHRGDNLEIRSPIDGIVISGDLDKVHGAPLDIGESLFEIAPLDRLLVEVEINDSDINLVRDNAEVSIRLEAYPWRTWQGTIAKIQPRSEIRDHENVFIAEVRLDNCDLHLRPGMKGRAKVSERRHPLAWNLFHKPCESFLFWIGW